MVDLAVIPSERAKAFPLEGFPLVVAVLVVYAWLFAWFPALRSPNELSRLYQTRAIVNEHALPLNEEMVRRGPVGDVAVRAGQYYAAKAPGISLLGVPVYAALRAWRGGDRGVTDRAAIYFLRLFACAIPAAIAAEVMRRVLGRRFPRRLAAAGAALFALGTLVWPYATQLASHATTTAALVACWDAIDRCRETARARWAWWAGFTAGAAVLLEYTSVLYVVPLGGYAVLTAPSRWRVILVGAAGAAVPLALLAAVQRTAFGSPFANPYSFLANPVYVRWHARGLFGVGAPSLHALVTSFVDPARGLFAYAPFLALGFFGLPALFRRDRTAGALCTAAALLGVVFTAGFDLRAWGWSVGPRHLTALCAFLLPPALACAEQLREQGYAIVAAGLAAYSVLALALVVVVCPYLPDDLTNPMHQLVLPLAREGFHVSDLASMATGQHGIWTLLPWAGAVLVLALPAVAMLGGASTPLRSARFTLAAAVAGLVLILATRTLGGRDAFERSRALVRAVYDPRGASVAALFDPP